MQKSLSGVCLILVAAFLAACSPGATTQKKSVKYYASEKAGSQSAKRFAPPSVKR